MLEGKETDLHNQKQALWRSVIKSTGSTLLWVLILLVLGGLYLTVNAKAANAGRAYLNLQDQVEDAERKNSDLIAQKAIVTSPQRMKELAESLGFRYATDKDVRYVNTEETPKRTDFHAPSPRSSLDTGVLTVSPAYTETLWDAVKRWLGVGGGE